MKKKKIDFSNHHFLSTKSYILNSIATPTLLNFRFIILTNSMGLSPSLEAASCIETQ
jgi:hypothetical protein